MYGLDAAVEGWQPDLMTFGKVIGGGLPVGAFGGRADIMAHARPDRAGLPGRHAVREPDRHRGRARHAAAAATTRSTGTWTRRAAGVGDLVAAALAEAGVPHRLQRAGNLFSVFFADASGAPTTTRPAASRTAAFAAFFHAMLDAGVYLPPSAFEAWFVSAAHDERGPRADRRRAPGSGPGRGIDRLTR